MTDLALATGNETAPTDRSYWVVPGLLLAGAYPGRVDPVESDGRLERLVGEGIRGFVNLTEDRDSSSGDGHLNAYDSEVTALQPSVRLIRRPIADHAVPSRRTMTETLDDIDSLLEERIPTYVHCWGGLGRTGTVVGCWMIRHRLAVRDDVMVTLRRLRRQDLAAGHLRSPQNGLQDRFVLGWEPGA